MRTSRIAKLATTGAMVVTAIVAGTAVPAQAATAKAVLNGSKVGVGIQFNYRSSATYDDILGAGYWSTSYGWPSVGGVYIGPGYCSQRWLWSESSGAWGRAGSDWGTGSHAFGSGIYKVVAYRC